MIELINVGEYTLKNLTLTEKASLTTGGGYWTSASVKERGVRSVRFSDGPAGLRPQGNKGDNLGNTASLPATCFPAHSALANSWNKELCFGVGKRIGEEAKFYGVDVLLAPDINIKRHPLCGRNFEYFSEDPYFNGKFGAAYANGVRSAGASACLKHFAANNREFGRMVCDSVIDERTLREIYLTGFEIAVKESSPAAVMAAYNKLNGVYCFENGYLLGNVLRGEWKFDGIVISDWGGTRDRAAAVNAGGDLEMPPCQFSPDEVLKAVEEGTLEESRLDESVQRLISLSEKCTPAAESCRFEEHTEYAKKCADECAVLLKNDGTLPLKSGKIALIGDIATNPVIQGGGSSKVNPKSTVSLLSCFEGAEYERGYIRGGSKRLEKRAIKLCEKVDTVIFCAGVYDGDCEGADRESYSLPEEQVRLLESICKLGKKVVAVLFCGCAVDTSWDKNVNAVLYAGLSGQAGARSVADILTGKVNPSGKLAETFFESLDYVPANADFNSSVYSEIYSEGMNVGYRAGTHGVKYPFGYGLSYTHFSYGNLKLSDGGASFTVANTGKFFGGEAVQMYIRFPESANSADIQLKGFVKIFIGAGESAEVFIPFDEYSFRSYDARAKVWKKVSGEYGILICSSSADVRLSGTVNISGDSEYVAPCETEQNIISEYALTRDKKGRITVNINTPFSELKNAKGVFARLFSEIALGAVKKNATVYGTMQYLPLRTLAQYGKMKRNVIDGLIDIFNGKIFKGIALILKHKNAKR